MKRLIPIFLLIILLSACNRKERKQEVPKAAIDSPKVSEPIDDDGLSQQDSIKATGRQILVFLKEGNYSELIKYFSNEGVIFSPYGFIDTVKCKKLTPTDFIESVNKKWVLTWGSYDGTGEPIKLTIPAYLKKFVYNADYLNAEAVGFNQVMK